MASLCKRLGLGLFLIALMSGILLATDLERRQSGGPKVWRVALIQHNSVPVLDDGRDGAIVGLAAAGFREGDNLEITRFNAEGDIGTANTIAREVVNGSYDLVLTMSTVSMQSVANANQQTRKRHVFGLVADPFGSLAGLDRANPMKHPPYMVGQGILVPVMDSFQLARQMNPGLNKIGVVWNPAESNSRIFTEKAREVAGQLGIELLEAQADNSSAVLEATHSLIGRGAQALWMGGDVTVMAAADTMIANARKAGVPTFSIIPGKPDRGTLFDVGVNFFECGKLAGLLAADILKGTDPATVPIRDVLELVPKRLIVNRQALRGLKEGWSLPPDVLRRADILVDDQGIHEKAKR
jgi:ABC-type uncharacterized transport system substrate-binding protein